MNASRWSVLFALSLMASGCVVVSSDSPVCGDKIVDFGEQCDDGNKLSGDGCSSTCFIESTCLADNAPCFNDTECCANYCAKDGYCGAPGCYADDVSCSADSQCCSGVCAKDGYCGVPLCNVDNQACSFDSDCCSNLCDKDGYCGLALSCAPVGENCIYDNDCCVGYICGSNWTCVP